MPPIYVDLDNTLGYGVFRDAQGEIFERFVPRPGAEKFLSALARHGEPTVLTASEGRYARRALSSVPGNALVSGLISREDLHPVEARVHEISVFLEDLSRRKGHHHGYVAAIAEGLLSEIPRLGPPGPVFDDQPAESHMYWMKATAVGIDESMWVQVPPFSPSTPDRGGLAAAYGEFLTRFPSAYPERPAGRRPSGA